MTRKWSGYRCGACKVSLSEGDVIKDDMTGWLSHRIDYVADYCGDQARYECTYCGPVRWYGERKES